MAYFANRVQKVISNRKFGLHAYMTSLVVEVVTHERNDSIHQSHIILSRLKDKLYHIKSIYILNLGTTSIA